MSEFSKLLGKTVVGIEGAVAGSDRIVITCADLSRFTLEHHQSCCESVRVEDVAGDPQDLVGHVVQLAEEASNSDNPPEYHNDSWTWTFYKLRTQGGDLTVRWLGESDGYYSESVDVVVSTAPEYELTEAQQVLRDRALEQGLA